VAKDINVIFLKLKMYKKEAYSNEIRYWELEWPHRYWKGELATHIMEE